LRIVFDTNLLISAVFYGGKPLELLNLIKQGQVDAIVTPEILAEYEILVLKDRDQSSGRQNDQNDRKVYLETNPSNHRILKRWEIENYLFDKEILRTYCADKALVFDEPAYDEFVTDIVNQNLKDETGRIKNICGITTSINPEIFKSSIAPYITTSSIVYTELKECIFDRK
jgi:hypothetical protein